MPSRLASARAVLTVAALAAGPAWADGPLSTDRQAELRHLLLHDCGSCHGMTLRGGLGPELTPESLYHLPADGVAQVILDGVPGTPMPPWRPLLSEADAWWLAEALKQGDRQ